MALRLSSSVAYGADSPFMPLRHPPRHRRQKARWFCGSNAISPAGLIL